MAKDYARRLKKRVKTAAEVPIASDVPEGVAGSVGAAVSPWCAPPKLARMWAGRGSAGREPGGPFTDSNSSLDWAAMAAPTTEKRPSAPTAASSAPAHQPYVPDSVQMPEFTWPAVLAGVVLGILFGAISLYLVLKVGMTVSASIPVAVLSITLFRGLAKAFSIRPATILENNIVQTTGSAGESIAFGVGVTIPALLLLGFDMSLVRVMTVGSLGGLLGILMMIPLRRAFIVKQHGKLRYPEGTACADVLIVGEEGRRHGYDRLCRLRPGLRPQVPHAGHAAVAWT